MKSMLTMVTVSDMNRSVSFYKDTLGLTLRFQSPDWSEFDAGGTTLALHGGGVPGPLPSGKEQIAGRATLGFNVENLDQAFAEVKSKGARVLMPPMERAEQGIRLAIVLDPDGLPVSLAQTTLH